MTLSPRERVLVGGLLPVVVGVALWQLVWQPIQNRRAALVSEIQILRQIEAAALATDPAATPDPIRTEPLAARVTRHARTAGLDLSRLDPEGARMRVTLSDAGFDDLIGWIAALEQDGVLTTAIQIDRRPAPGQVAARLTLESRP